MTFWFNSPQSLSKREAEERLSEVSYYVLAKYWISLILFFFFFYMSINIMYAMILPAGFTETRGSI